MLARRCHFSTLVASNCRAFTRTELLVAILVLMLLGIVFTGALSGYLRQSKIDHAMENVRAVNLLLGQYATDNNDTYPVGQGTPAAGKSEGIALNLLQNKYALDPALFAIGSTPRYNGTASDFSDFTASNIGWDFTGGVNASTGITAAAPDLLPTIYATGEAITYPAGSGLDVTLSGNGPLDKLGLAVGYKDNSAKFLTATIHSDAVLAPGFLSPSFTDKGPYTQIKP